MNFTSAKAENGEWGVEEGWQRAWGKRGGGD